VFKRRDPRTFKVRLQRMIWPKGGWGRALWYLTHRVRRLPDTPEKIARGIFAGVYVTFTPFYGFHFFLAVFAALVVRGNIIASMMATFFGNPLTFPFIGFVSLKIGTFMLGRDGGVPPVHVVVREFSQTLGEVGRNFIAIFTPDPIIWGHSAKFTHDILLPYIIGGSVPGVIGGAIAYFASVPVIRAYQDRRRLSLQKRFERAREKAHLVHDEPE
jgi:uncharacterized protein (DUF2062 family)